MTTLRRQPDDDDRQAERLLRESLRAPAVRPEFRRGLGESLASAHAELTGTGGTGGAGGHGPSYLDAVVRERRASANGDAHLELAAGGEARPGDAARRHREAGRRTLRPGLLLASAVSLLLVIGLWGNRPSYSWSMMVQAMGDQPWVHAETVRGGVVRVKRWLSVGRQVDASRSLDRVVLITGGAGQTTRLSYAPGADHVVREPQAAPTGGMRGRGLLPRLLGVADDIGPGDLLAMVERESWRSVTTPGGQKRIELTVTLSINGASSDWVLLLDPETHLPLSARRVGEGGEEEPSIGEGGDGRPDDEYRFSYPSSGPSSLSELGVPDEAAAVALLPGARAVRSVTPALRSVTGEPSIDPAEFAGEKRRIAVGEPPATPDPPPLGDPLPGDALSEQIDRMLEQHWLSVGVSPAPRSSDAEFLRRVYLDLVGRIPRVGEARVFLEDSASDRRRRLVDDLLASRDHATHLAAVWRRMLIPPSVDLSPYGGPSRLDRWLADRFQDNLPYDELARGLLLAEGRISESGPLLFYAALKLNPEEIAAQTSRTFLGLRLECAQCHDHPFDERIAQDDFWGVAALFAQISRPRGEMNVTSSVLRVHDNRRGEVYLPDTDVIVRPRLPFADRPLRDSADAPPRRRQFVDWLVEPHNERFGQATVNRVWAHLFGRGLVDPVDDIREENPAAVPGLLDLLAKDFARSGFDLRRLLRQVVLSDAYQLTSESSIDDPAAGQVFARMNIKSFTAEQLYDGIAVATRGGAGADQGLARFGDASRESFIRLFEAPGGSPIDYHAGIPQALTLMHGGLIHSATDLTTSGLLRSLEAPFFTDEQRVETLFLATLSRRPTEDELQTMSEHVAGGAGDDDRQRRLGDVLWALLNTAEFTLNH